MVYLIHFHSPLAHAQHYLGYTTNLKKRIAQHRKGSGARLMEVLQEQGIEWSLVRVWSAGTRRDERRMKNCHGSRVFCPVCRGEMTLEQAQAEMRRWETSQTKEDGHD